VDAEDDEVDIVLNCASEIEQLESYTLTTLIANSHRSVRFPPHDERDILTAEAE
jgi:hypothetical protein